MSPFLRFVCQGLLLMLPFGGIGAQEQRPEPLMMDTARIERLTGFRGKLDAAENVFRIAFPRDDLEISVAGLKMTPSMGFTSWAAFTPARDRLRVMGDLVLLEDQVDPVMSEALDNGLEVTALHNHFLWDTPKVMFMHIGGTGEPDPLAIGIGRVLAKSRATGGGPARSPQKAADAVDTTLDPDLIASIIGAPVEKTGGVYKVTLGRSTAIEGHPAGKAMGVNTWAVFAGGDEKAFVDGDFAVTESELQAVLKSLRRAGITITSIHNHMVGESPRIVFLHYWGRGPVRDLARAVKAALEISR